MQSQMDIDNVDEFIGRLKRFTGIEQDRELARYFGFTSHNQFATYRSRGTISTSGLHLILKKLGGSCNLNWLFYGRGNADANAINDKEYSDLLMQTISALGIDVDGPEARTINNHYLALVDSDLSDEEKRAEINLFLSTLLNYLFTRVNLKAKDPD